MNLLSQLSRCSAMLVAMGILGTQAPAAAQTIPRYDHVVVVMMENQNYSTIVGNSAQAPFINSLVVGGASFSDAHGEWHPSLPNYYALLSGSTQGLTNSTPPAPGSINAANLPNQLISNSLSFADYSDEAVPAAWLRFANLPGTATAPNAVDKWLKCPAPVAGQGCGFPSTDAGYAALPTVTFVHGNEYESMHDNNILGGDTWLKNTVGGYAQWALTHNSLLIVTFDEDEFTSANRIPTVFYGAGVYRGSYSQTINHYNMLRTLQDMYGLTPLANAASATPITNVWGNNTAGGAPVAAFSATSIGQTATFTDASTDTGGTIGSYSWNFGDGATATSARTSHTYAAAGTYTATLTVTDSINNRTSSTSRTVTVSASIPPGNIVASNSGKCLNVVGNTSSAVAVQSSCGSSGNLVWTLAPVGSYYHIVAQGSGMCLNVPGGSTADSTQLIQYACQSASSYNDQWSLVPAGQKYHLVNRNSGKCINISGSSTAEGAKVIQYTCGSGANNDFSFVATTAVAGTASVNLASAFNRAGHYSDGTSFSASGGIDNKGHALSASLLGSSLTFNGVPFTFGAANGANEVSAAGQTITLPSGQFSSLQLLALAVNGSQASQTFTVTYADNTTASFTQSLSDWFAPQDYAGELKALIMAYRNLSNGTSDNRTFNLSNYKFTLNTAKAVKSVQLPNNANIEVLAMTLVP